MSVTTFLFCEMTINPRRVDTRVTIVVSLGISGPCDSPDLALLGYSLFGSLERHVVGRRLRNNEEVEMTLSECL
jgi:hypothetical protein